MGTAAVGTAAVGMGEGVGGGVAVAVETADGRRVGVSSADDGRWTRVGSGPAVATGKPPTPPTTTA